MRVQLVDPSAFTPPYDRSLAAALARAGNEVELLTSRFGYGPVPEAEGYSVTEAFYRRAEAKRRSPLVRRALKAVEHLPDMIRLRSRLDADVVHYQWLAAPAIDAFLLPDRRPRVLTAHYVLPPRPSRRAVAAARRLYGGMDALIAHSEHGARRLREEVGLPAERVHVIEHGALDYLTRLPEEAPLPADLAEVDRPVVLFFGLIRPYKGIDVLLEAFTGIEGAELWIVGNPRMDTAPFHRAADDMRGAVRFVERFVPDQELPAYFRRADLVVLPYLDGEQSGVLHTALAFGKPVVASAVGGFPEVGEAGAARIVPPGDAAALRDALADLLGDDGARRELAEAAAAAAAGRCSWDETARRTVALYEELVGGAK